MQQVDINGFTLVVRDWLESLRHLTCTVALQLKVAEGANVVFIDGDGDHATRTELKVTSSYNRGVIDPWNIYSLLTHVFPSFGSNAIEIFRVFAAAIDGDKEGWVKLVLRSSADDVEFSAEHVPTI
jgi:hypothetical protein